MSRARLVSTLSPLFLLFAFAPCSSAQFSGGAQLPANDPSLEMGFIPYGSFNGGNIDSISLLSRKLNIRIPLVSYPQRGGRLKMSFSLVYNWPILKYNLDGPNCNPQRPNTCYQDWYIPPHTIKLVMDGMPNGPVLGTNVLTIGLPDGSSTLAIPTASSSAITVDGSGIVASSYTTSQCGGVGSNQGWVVRDHSGTAYTYDTCQNLTSAKDLNGNQIVANLTNNGGVSQVTSYTDTLGRVIPYFYGPSGTQGTTNLAGCTGALPTGSASLWTVPGPNGGTLTFKFCMANVSASLPNCATDGSKRCEDDQATYPQIQSIVLPNGTAWTFQYDSASAPGVGGPNYGDLIGITFPTGGTISYVWNSPTSLPCNTAPPIMNRAVQSRTINANDGQGPHTTTYSQVVVGSGNYPQIQTTVLDAIGNQTVHTFTSVATTCDYYETQAQSFQGSQTLLETKSTQYHTNIISSGSNPKAINVVPTIVTASWPNAQTSQVQNDYAFDAPLSGQTVADTTYGNVVAHREYDYGNAAPGALLRQTTTVLLYQNSSAYKSANLVALPATVTVLNGSGTQVAQTTYGYDENNGSPQGVLGNQTSTTYWLNGGTSPKSQNVFNTQGMPHQTIDPDGNTTTYTYDATGAYLSQVQYPTTGTIQHIEKFSFDANTGLLNSDTDQNNNTTTYKYADAVSRLTEVDFPDGGQTLISYNDALPSPTTTTSLKLNNQGQLLTVVAVSDGLGRTMQTQLTTDPAGTDYVDTTRDGLGRISIESNPHRSASAPTDGTTTYTYDGLGRVTQVTRPDGSTVLTTYSGRATQVQDEGNGNQRTTRISQTDGLGHLTSACEVAPGPFVGPGGSSSSSLIGSAGTPSACGQDIAGTGFLATYQYDPMDNLLQVSQAGISNRTYGYNSLSELLAIYNPESATTNYTYDPAGNLHTKTDARGIQTTFTYDALNRILSKTFTDSTPPITNIYDVTVDGLAVQYPVGRLVKSYTPNAASVFGYDRMGRVANQWQCTPQNCGASYFPLAYTYDLIGDITSASNGVGVSFSYTFDTAAQLTKLVSSLSDPNHPATLLSNPTYSPDGELTSALLGNQVTETSTYNSRLFLTAYTAGPVYNFNVTSYAANGNVLSSTDSVNGNWAYNFDAFNRVTNSNQNSGQSIYTYVYDRFGNRWQQNGPHPFISTFTGNNPSNPANNNRMDGYSYDASGNLLNDGTTTYTYDAENRVTSAANSAYGTSAYVYDALGHRVRKTTVAKGTVDLLYDLNDDEFSEISTTGVWDRIEVHAAGRHFATYTPATTYFNYGDSLGTERARTTVSGALYESCTSLPFGDSLNCSATDSSPMHFTGEEHDTESGLDHFDHRKYGSFIGRWTSPDLLPGDQSDPQSLNRYAYTRNNPVSLTDLLGLQDGFRTGLCATLDDQNQIQVIDCEQNVSVPVDTNVSNLTPLPPQPSSQDSDLQAGSMGPNPDAGTASTGPSTLDGVRTGLDVLGLVPVVGDFANAASGIISLAQGNYGTAALSLVSAIPLVGNVGEAFKIAKLGEESVEGFRTFNSFKKFYGAAGEGMQWHHIVEQGGGRIARFGPEAIHNAENLVEVPTEIHREISGFYSSKKAFSEGKTVRQWLKSKSFEEQYKFGQQVLRDHGVN